MTMVVTQADSEAEENWVKNTARKEEEIMRESHFLPLVRGKIMVKRPFNGERTFGRIWTSLSTFHINRMVTTNIFELYYNSNLTLALCNS